MGLTLSKLLARGMCAFTGFVQEEIIIKIWQVVALVKCREDETRRLLSKEQQFTDFGQVRHDDGIVIRFQGHT
jgi:hypothetical protein